MSALKLSDPMHTSQVEVRVSVEPRIAVETAETVYERLISVT